MRSVALRLCAALLLASPTAAAFFSGGFFAEPRLWAALSAWAVVLLVALFAPTPLPRGRAESTAVAGLLLLGIWTLVSTSWAPLDGPAWEDSQRLALYAGALIAAAALLRDPVFARAAEPALALGALAVAVYALAERLLPGVFDYASTRAAFGRLEQPLTYWNTLGTVAAVGAVLATRLGGSPERSPGVRVAAVAGLPWLGAALYLTLSRGALLAAAVGLAALVVAAPTRPQLRALTVGLGAMALAAIAAELLPELGRVTGDMATRERQGAAMLAGLVLLSGVAVAAMATVARRERVGRLPSGAFRRPPAWAVAGAAALALAAAATVAVTNDERPRSADGRPAVGAERLRSIESNRYAYWRVAFGEWADAPLAGGGSGSFRVEWLRERDVAESVQDAHSLTIETAAELGLVGIALLLAFVGGIAAAARRAVRIAPGAAAGAVAALAGWIVHAQIDWLWEMPAASLQAIVLAGLVIALSDGLDPVRDEHEGSATVRGRPPHR
jgi:hypothetical protein